MNIINVSIDEFDDYFIVHDSYNEIYRDIRYNRYYAVHEWSTSCPGVGYPEQLVEVQAATIGVTSWEPVEEDQDE